jgi:hypothetical protein
MRIWRCCWARGFTRRGKLPRLLTLGQSSSPWQRAYVERVIGTIRRECLDHMIVFNEACTGTLQDFWNIIIGIARTWHWRKTLQSHGRSSRRSRAGSSRFRCWAGCIIVTDGERRKSGDSDDPSLGRSVDKPAIKCRAITDALQSGSAPTCSRASRPEPECPKTVKSHRERTRCTVCENHSDEAIGAAA